jgi:hypothetical protein
MTPLPASIVAVLQPVACLFTNPTWVHAQVLLAGTLLAQGPRTVTAALLLNDPAAVDKRIQQLETRHKQRRRDIERYDKIEAIK